MLASVIFYSCNNSSTKKTYDIPSEITSMYSKYVSAWSDADFTTITEDIYQLPFSLLHFGQLNVLDHMDTKYCQYQIK